MLKPNEIEILRTLAQKYMEYASLPRQAETRSLWYALNRRQMQKPMVLIDQLPWNELSAADPFLTCVVQDPYWRRVENDLRMTIYKWEHLPVDMVLPPYIVLPRLFSDDGYGIDAVEKTLGSADGVMAHMFHDILANEEDVEKIHTPNVIWHKEEEEAVRQQADMLFAGIAPYKMAGVGIHLGLWDRISSARGVTNCYIDLLDRPEHMHAIIGRLTDCTLELIDRYNELGAFDTVTTLCHCSHTFCDDLPSGEEGFTTSDKVWAMGLAQLFSSVSPEVTDEFEIPYMQKLFPNSAPSITAAASSSPTGWNWWKSCPTSARSPAARGATGRFLLNGCRKNSSCPTSPTPRCWPPITLTSRPYATICAAPWPPPEKTVWRWR